VKERKERRDGRKEREKDKREKKWRRRRRRERKEKKRKESWLSLAQALRGCSSALISASQALFTFQTQHPRLGSPVNVCW
jgi:hypothetical protein